MSIEENVQEELEIGDFPKSQFLVDTRDTGVCGDTTWIGIKAYSLDKKIKNFLWWRNTKECDLNSEKGREIAALLVTRFKLGMDVEIAFGFPVDLFKSNSKKNYISIPEELGLYGLYIEEGKRSGFNFYINVKGPESIDILKHRNPEEFDEIFQKTKEILPYNRK